MNPQSYASTPAIQVCQPGWDVRNCPDWAYLFNSNWPSLAIAYETTIPQPSGGPATINHNLGFIPYTVVSTYVAGTGSYGRLAAGIQVNKTQVKLSPITASTSYTIRCFNVDISKEQSYPLPKSAQARLPYNNQFGIKAAKNDRLITSNDLNDFVIHSRAQSPAVLAVATQAGKYYNASTPAWGRPGIVYPLKTSYIPWFTGWNSSDGINYSMQTVNGTQVVDNAINFDGETDPYFTLVVLRDPLFYPNVVRVVY